MLKSLRFLLTEDTKIMIKIIKYMTSCIALHNFMIKDNDEINAYFIEEDDCASDVDSNNELDCPLFVRITGYLNA